MPVACEKIATASSRSGSFWRELSSDCGLVLLANITLDERQQPVADPLVRELPVFLQETAFLDRMKGLLPGWEVRKLTGTAFAASIGLKSDFFGDALIAMRSELEHDQYCAQYIRLRGARAYRRNEEAVRSLASGMRKLLYPHGESEGAEFYRYCVRPALDLRQIVWNQLYTLDAEYHQFDRDLECDLLSE